MGVLVAELSAPGSSRRPIPCVEPVSIGKVIMRRARPPGAIGPAGARGLARAPARPVVRDRGRVLESDAAAQPAGDAAKSWASWTR